MSIGWVGFVVLVVSVAVDPLRAAQIMPDLSKPRKMNQCLSDEKLDLMKKARELNRPTTQEDATARTIFDPDMFIGTWNFDWLVPDMPIASGGTYKGTYTIKRLEGCFYDGTLKVESPDGTYTGTLLLAYSPENGYLTWYETDSRGLSLLKVGPVGGDPGRYFTHFWEAPPVTFKGQTVRFAGTTFITSDHVFRYRPRVSFDGKEWVSYGNPWFTKVGGEGAVRSRR